MVSGPARMAVMCLLMMVAAVSPWTAGASSTQSECRLLKDSCRVATQNSDHRRAVRLGAELQRVAAREGDHHHMAYAMYYQGVSNVILGNSEIGKSQLDSAFELAERIGDDTLRLSVHNGYGVYEADAHADYAAAQRHFYKALEYAVRIGDPFRQALVESNLAETASIRRDVSGLKYALGCYEWGVANGNAHLEFAGAYHCANLYNIAGDTAMAMRYIRKADEIASRENYAGRAAVFNLYGAICAASGRDEEALGWLRRAEACAGEAQGATLPELYLTWARVLASMGRLRESDRMVARGLHVSDSLSIRSSVAPLLGQLAANYESRGDHRRALEVFKEYKEACDSAHAHDRDRSINELRVQYDIDRREHEADMHRLMLRDERRKTVILLISLVSVTVLLMMLWLNYRRQKHLYRNIVKANRDALAREKELLSRLADTATGAASKPGNDEGSPGPEAPPDAPDADSDAAATMSGGAKADMLFARLRGLMEDEEVYRDSGLTREKLAEMLGTNRTYLSQLVADKADKGYYQFVNGYRIKKAVEILSGPAGVDYPLKALAADLGFKSMTTFYKTFQEAVGMTPSAYRDIAGKL